MNPTDRITIWEGHLAVNQEFLKTVDERYSGAPESLKARVRANLEDSIRNCLKNIQFWQERALTN